MGGMIHRIMGILHGCTPVPKTLNPNEWIHALTRGTSSKNLKGLLINKVTNLYAKWTCIIVSLFLTAMGRASDVNLSAKPSKREHSSTEKITYQH
jgi:hypothetical protein